jgi:hypothetical protein
MHKEPQGTALKTLARVPCADLERFWNCYQLITTRQAITGQCLRQPLLGRAPEHPIGQLLHQGLTGLFNRLESPQ